MTWRSCRRLLLLGLLALLAADASAQTERSGPINVDVVVSHISQRPPSSASPPMGGLMNRAVPPAPRRVREIDERIRRLDATLRKQFRYDDIEVVERHRMVLDLEEVGTVRLPNGRRFRVRPMDVNERGVLMAVDVEKSTRMDVRAPNRHLVVIGAEPYRDGTLVISVEPIY